jgi:hypothetical protein
MECLKTTPEASPEPGTQSVSQKQRKEAIGPWTSRPLWTVDHW